MIDHDLPRRLDVEADNDKGASDKDHVDNVPDADPLIETGEEPLHDDDALDCDQADEPPPKS